MANVSNPSPMERLQASLNTRTGRELGIPHGARVVTFTMDAGEMRQEWKGYTLDFLGEQVPVQTRQPHYIYAEKDGVGMKVWRLCVRFKGAQAFIEALTLGSYGFPDLNLKNLDPHGLEGNRKVLDFLPNLYPHRLNPSRGKGRDYSIDDVESAYTALYHEMNQHHPSQMEVAGELGCETRTVRRVLGDVGETWVTFSERIRRSLRSRTVSLPRR